jgi:ABC-type sugar transport system substrate-binding protein
VRSLRKLVVFAVLVAVAAGVAACGSSSSSSSKSGGSAPASTGSTSTASTGSTGSGTKTPKPQTIGVIPSTSSSENLGIWIAQLKAAAAPLGWKVIVCDGAGVVTKMENCAQSFVTQKVSAIVTMALGGPEIPQGFAQAKAAGIPVMAEGTSVTPGYEKFYTGGIYGDDIPAQGAATINYVASHFKGVPIIGDELTANYGGQGYVNGEVAQLKKLGLKFTDLRDTNLANLVSSIETTIQAELQAHTGKVVLLTYNDIDPSLLQPIIQRAGRSKDVTEIVRYDDATTVKLMRAGDNILVSDTKNWQHIFDLLTAMLNHSESGAAFPPNSQTVNVPGAIVVGIKQYPAGANRYYPFAPALKAQLAIWGKTYKLQPSTLTAP